MLHYGRCNVCLGHVYTGLDDTTLLPNFPYRDDALDLWNATKTYVSNVVKHFYKCDGVSITVFSINFLMNLWFHLCRFCWFFECHGFAALATTQEKTGLQFMHLCLQTKRSYLFGNVWRWLGISGRIIGRKTGELSECWLCLLRQAVLYVEC